VAKILVVDDESAFRESVMETLADLGHEPSGAAGAAEALAVLDRERFTVLFVDFRMPGINGVETIRLIREKLKHDTPAIIMITAFADTASTIAAMSLGAFDYLNKPVSRADIERVLGAALKAYEGLGARADSSAPASLAPKLLGKSRPMHEVLKMIGRLAATDVSALITGETGTGKELVAKAIHENSPRAKEPFVAINCAAIPENLLESELFGHERGAFTGAQDTRKGSFQLAEGGTLFLDEIGDMNPTLQAKILRAVQEREVTPIGGRRPIKVNVRILAATHQNLRELVAKGVFREDLYYRLNVIQLALPPLRDRREDIGELSHHFLAMASAGAKVLGESALSKLGGYDWPGNIRELKNVIDRASVVSRGRLVQAEDISFAETQGAEAPNLNGNDGAGWHQAIGRLEKSLLLKALHEAEGNRSEAARRLGIQRQLLYAKLKEHEINP